VLPTTLWFFDRPDPRGIWLAVFVSNVVGAVIAWLWFRRGTWRRGDVRDTSRERLEPDGVDPAHVDDRPRGDDDARGTDA
jgi:hypothetical protein